MQTTDTNPTAVEGPSTPTTIDASASTPDAEHEPVQHAASEPHPPASRPPRRRITIVAAVTLGLCASGALALTTPMDPLGWCFALATLGVMLRWVGARRTGLALLIVAPLLLFVAASPYVAGALFESLESRYPPIPVADTLHADVIVVLGGGVSAAYPPRLHPDLGSASDRLAHAARLYHAGKAPRLILCDSTSSPMAELLGEWGVPNSAMVLETGSMNTHENAAFIADMIRSQRIEGVLLVTSALHMRRALATFRAAGIDATPVPTDFEYVHAPNRRTFLSGVVPSAGALQSTQRALHEYGGYLYYQLRGWIK
ncbi:MAG: YdcF family protein [Phycisphaera sp.]|nr:YdcF family protein [Phycisphaera sp.]